LNIENLENGTKTNDFLEVGPYFADPRANTRAYARIPYTIIKGNRKGPTLCIVSGTHGTEYAGIGAAIRLSNETAPESLSGTLVIVRALNILGFWERTYLCPIDGANIQGTWPGKQDGSLSQMITYSVFNNLVSKANYFIDLHGGDSNESEIGYSLFYKSGKSEIDEKSEGMARALGFEYISLIEDQVGAPLPTSGTSFRVMPLHGISSALCELGQGDVILEEEVNTVFGGLVNVMRYLMMLEGEVRVRDDYKIVRNVSNIGITQSGLFHSKVNPGDKLSKGELIGVVKNLEGDTLEEIHAPTNGVAMLMIHNPVVVPGEKIMMWGRLD
jgi:uncharacterized protein